MKLLYQAPEAVIVVVNCQKDLMQYEVLGNSKDSLWENGANTTNFEENDSEPEIISTRNLWDE